MKGKNQIRSEVKVYEKEEKVKSIEQNIV